MFYTNCFLRLDKTIIIFDLAPIPDIKDSVFRKTFICPVHITVISRREIGEKSARYRRENKLSRPTERHVTSHVIDLDICEYYSW